MKKFRNVALAILIFATAFVIFICTYFNYNLAPVSSDSSLKTIEIKPGGVDSIASTLKENNLIKNKLIFKVYITLTGKKNLKASTYQLSENMGVRKIVDILSSGNSYNPDEVVITFKEGINMRDIANLISENTNNTKEDVYDLLNDKSYLDELIDKYWFITDDIKNNRIYYSLEGYLFPNTYAFLNKDVTVKEIFSKMLDEMDNQLSYYKDSMLNNKLSIHELLTLSSIVELEGASSSDRDGVAGVFYNRLDSDMTLGSDVTTYYGIKVAMSERDLTKKEINTCNDYNTRCSTFKKLPVSPICISSIESIKAVLNPVHHDYYYFVADKNKKTYFTKTYNEHLEMVASLKEDGLYYEY